MKLSEFENSMKTSGFESVPFSEYISVLNKRVHDDSLKCQHCYAMALELKLSDYQNSITLIQYGLEHFAKTWLDKWMSFCNLGIVYERQGDYINAKKAYLAAKATLSSLQKSTDYAPYICTELLRTEMHVSGFTYTNDLESFYNEAIKSDDFAKGFRKTQFYLSLAEIIIAVCYNDTAKAKEAREKAYKAIDKETKTDFDKIPERHSCTNSVQPTEEAIKFLK